MTSTDNPWKDMQESSQRRIDNLSDHNIFWITDLKGGYGFCLQSKNIFNNTDSRSYLKGINIVKRNSAENIGELFLLLNQKEDWPIFLSLCNDLVSMTHKYDDDLAMISAVEIRLNRWQQLLKLDSLNEMSLKTQMGLYSELTCLLEFVIPKYGVSQSITTWVGPDFDKQDFLLDNAILEVKSYKTSKGEVVNISSVNQLYSEKIPLFLLTYGLTISENGTSIDDLVLVINKLLESKANDFKDQFDSKLMEYGYIPELATKPLINFIVDKSKGYLVSDSFPKLDPTSLVQEIISVKYSIDMLLCEQHEVDLLTIL